MWAQTKGTGLSEAISFGGGRVAGFGVGATNDPAATLTPDQQTWTMNALNDLNTKIIASTGSTCPTWGADQKSMVGCFQPWFNSNYAMATPPVGTLLRVDGVLDQDTFNALQMVAAMHPADFPSVPAAPPGVTPVVPPANPATPAAPATPVVAAKAKMSTGEMVGIGTGVVVVIGGIYYLITRKKGKR